MPRPCILRPACVRGIPRYPSWPLTTISALLFGDRQSSTPSTTSVQHPVPRGNADKIEMMHGPSRISGTPHYLFRAAEPSIPNVIAKRCSAGWRRLDCWSPIHYGDGPIAKLGIVLGVPDFGSMAAFNLSPYSFISLRRPWPEIRCVSVLL